MTIRNEATDTLAPVHEDGYATVYQGDCLAIMRAMPSNSVDAIVTDPPYGLTKIDETKTRKALSAWLDGDDSFVPDGKGFMNKRWDQFVPPPAVWREAMRVLKPGGYMLCFAGSRTIDLMTLSVRLGGFEIRETIDWVYGSGFPKSMNIAKEIDKKSGFHGAVIGTEKVDIGMQGGQMHTGRPQNVVEREIRELSPEAKKWNGWGTALKPAHEPIIVAQKPPFEDAYEGTAAPVPRGLVLEAPLEHLPWCDEQDPAVPAKSCQDDCPVAEMNHAGAVGSYPASGRGFADIGTSSPKRSRDSQRFPKFRYQAKAKRDERPTYTADDGELIAHSTVKPTALMEWLVGLVTPAGGVVIDPFLGSGTTCEAATLGGFDSVGIELDDEHIPLIIERLAGKDIWAGGLFDGIEI